MTMRITVSGTNLVASSLEELRRQIDFRNFWPVVVDRFSQMQSAWFASQGQGSWVPLSPSYAAWKSMVAPGNPLLVLSGDLRSARISARESSNRLDIAIDAPFYWQFHQFGTIKMPARPPYVIDDEMQRELADSVAQEISRRTSGL